MIFKAAVAAAIATLAVRAVTALPLSEPEVSTKIVGGNVAPQAAFPFIVSLASGGHHFCGGSLINAEFVLTAAHCLISPPPNIMVRAGSNDRTSGGTVVRGIRSQVYPGFDPILLDHDVAILRISPPIKESATIKYAKLPQKGSDPQQGMKTVAGWGFLRDQTGPGPMELRQVSVPLIPRQKCRETVTRVTENMICAAGPGKDACQGDSGGPLIDAQTGVLQGVVSFGLGGCASPTYPGVYARVDSQLDFIQSVVGQPGAPTQPGPPSETPGVDPGNPPDSCDGGNPPGPPGGGQPPSPPGGGQPPGFPGGGQPPGPPGGGQPPGFPGGGQPPGPPGGGQPPGPPGGGQPPGPPGGGQPPGPPGGGQPPGFPGGGQPPGFPGGGQPPGPPGSGQPPGFPGSGQPPGFPGGGQPPGFPGGGQPPSFPGGGQPPGFPGGGQPPGPPGGGMFPG
ncbi:hypothetical protein MY11210_006918 [Beauveria gryllotalpidicola]